MPACSPAAQGDLGFFWSLESSWAFAREADGSGGDEDDGEITDRIASLLEKSEYACVHCKGARRVRAWWMDVRAVCLVGGVPPATHVMDDSIHHQDPAADTATSPPDPTQAAMTP